MAQTVSSADAHVDDEVEFEVLEEVRVSDILVIPKGGIAWGTVTEAQPRRRMARGGKLEIVMDSVRLVDGQKAALRAVKNAKGGGHTGAMTAGIVATGLLFWPAAPFFLFMHGKDITIPKGAEVPTFVNGNFRLDAAKFRPSIQEVQIAQRPGAVTSVAISSTPAGADIYLDAGFVGNTPSTLNIGAGTHSIVVKKNGFQDWTRQMSFSGGTVTLSAELVAGAGSPMPVATSKPVTATATVPAVTTVSVRSIEPQKAADAPAADSRQGWIGISTKHVGSGGAVITAVTAGGPAAQAGLKAGDVINDVNGIPLKDEDFDAKIAAYKSGSKLRIGYMRDSWALETAVTVGTDTR
jgi:PEGA domain/PDZ domain